MTDEKKDSGDKMCKFAPEEKDAAREDAVLYRKTRTFEELTESSDRCLRHVSERLDQIEEEILSGSQKKKTD
jgi:hypothetical protein